MAAIIANNKIATGEAAEPAPEQPVGVQPAPEKSFASSLPTTQWLALGSLVVSLIGLYYKREEIKNHLSKRLPHRLCPRTRGTRSYRRQEV